MKNYTSDNSSANANDATAITCYYNADFVIV